MLYNQFDELVSEHLKKCLLATIPEVGARSSMGRAVLAARTLCTGDVVTAQLPPLQRELTNACNLLQDISEGKGPTPASAAKFGNFALQFLKKVEMFPMWNTSVADEVNDVVVQTPVTLWGQPAVKCRYDVCVSTPGVVSPKDLKFLRMLRWTLADAEADQVELWEGESVRNAKDRIATERLKALRDAEEAEEVRKQRRMIKRRRGLCVAPPLEGKSIRKNKELAPEKQAEQIAIDNEELPPDGANGLMSLFGMRAS